MFYFPLVFKNSLRNPRRSLLTITSMALSFCILGVLISMYNMFFVTEVSPDIALRLIVRNRISITNVLPLSYERQIARVPGVRAVTIYQWFGGVYKDTRDPNNAFPRFAVDADQILRVHTDYTLPEAETRAFVRERTACIVGRTLAHRTKLQIGDRVHLQGDIFPVNLDLTVRGIYDAPRDDDHLYFHFDYLNESLFHGQADFAGMYVLLVDRPESVQRVSRQIDEMYRNSPDRTKTETEKAFMLGFLSYLGNVKAFLFSLCGSLMITVMLVSANTMAMSVRERSREVGILKTLGFTWDMILRLIVEESALIALTGGLLGLGMALLVIEGMRSISIPMVSLRLLHLSPMIFAICTVLAVLVGVVSCFVPALTSARRSILDSLRITD